MNTTYQFLWVIFPYLMLTTFVVGHIYRYNTDQMGWSAQSSEILEKRKLKWGSILFHWGIIFAFFGHVAGILIPREVYDIFGINDYMYHLGALGIGGVVGVMALIGMIILIYRRLTTPRIRLHSSKKDWITAILLFIVVLLGVYVTVVRNITVGEFDYRATIGPWFRGLFTFTPDPTLMIEVPLFFKLHILAAFLLFGIWPFTRLVHLWSLPLEYLKRSYIIYRSQNFKKSFLRSTSPNKK